MRYVDVQRYLVHRGANFSFDRSIMRDLLMRLIDDPIFALRMPTIVRAIGAMLQYTGLAGALN